MERTLYSNNNDIDTAEKELVLNVLTNYDFNIIQFTKVRSVYKVETTSGIICLKRMKRGSYKAKNGSILVRELLDNGFDNTAKYFTTKKGYNYVKKKKNIFYVTEWIDGKECDLDVIEEACNCTELLAKFHLACSGVNSKNLAIRNNLKNWPKIFKSNLYDLEKFMKIIKNKRVKSEFDMAYYDYIESYYHRGTVALNFLNTSEYYKLSKAASEKKTICHDSFYYQNIIKKENQYYIVDLDSILIDLHVNDLGKLIRRLMYNREYQWDFFKAKKIIDSYCSINPLTNSEIEVMLALIVFPHKFWKLGKKRYLKNKNWNEAKYVRKLSKIVHYNEMQDKFLCDYLSFLKSLDENNQ